LGEEVKMNSLYVALIFLSTAYTMLAQATLGNIDVPLTIAGITFNVKFEPEKVTPESMARRLCIEQAATIGFAEEALTSGCIEPITRYLQSSVTTWFEEKTMEVPLTISEQTYRISFIPERDSIASIARRFCTEQAPSIGVPPGSPACVEPTIRYLQSSVNSWMADKTLDFPITVNGKSFDMHFLPERETAITLARNLCVNQADAIGGITTENVEEACITPVKSYVQDRVDEWTAEKTLEIPLRLNGKSFDLSFIPSRESSERMARKLCVSQADEIGGLTDGNIVESCIQPVNVFIQGEVDKWTSEKTLSLSIKLNGKEFDVRFMPARESPSKMARKLCIEQADAIGGLTTDTVESECIAPVEKYLQKCVDEWVVANAAKAEQVAQAAQAAQVS
jgi:hypothetical protein